MTLLNILRAYEEILNDSGAATKATTFHDSDSDSDSPSSKNQKNNSLAGGKRAATQWCQTHFINERSLKESKDIASQLSDICAKNGLDPTASCGQDTDRVLRTLLMGMFRNCAFLRPGGTYQQTFDKQVRILT